MTQSTIREALARATRALEDAGVPEPRADAEILLAHALGRDRAFLLAHTERKLNPPQADRYASAVSQRKRRRPLPYITGTKEFFGLDFEVSEAVMIPRPETEVLVEKIISIVKGLSLASPRVLDLGTGCGNIAVAIAKELANAHLVATDLSPQALAIARKNAVRHRVIDRIAFVACDLYAALRDVPVFHVIVSNPPYIRTADIASLQPEIRDHEPRAALDGGADGLCVVARIAAEAPRYLKGGGVVALEIGCDQAQRATELVESAGLATPRVEPDYSGRPRVVTARKPGS